MLQIHARKLAQRLLPVEQWKGIIAVSRGGSVPAALLARELSIRYVDTVCISSYDHDHQREMNVLKRAEGDGEGFIVIDDWWIPAAPRRRSAKCIRKRVSSLSSLSRPARRWWTTTWWTFRRTPDRTAVGYGRGLYSADRQSLIDLHQNSARLSRALSFLRVAPL